jgi:cytochrome c oxidase subunit 2
MMVAAAGLFLVAPLVGWWLPEGVSSHAWDIDALFYIILGITGFFFILTEGLLVYFMWTYASSPRSHGHVFGHHAEEEKVLWTAFFKRLVRPVSAILHNQHRVELAWTLVPAVILVYIAFVQINTWANVKYVSRMPKFENKDLPPQQVEVSARQFEWRIRYPSTTRMQAWFDREKRKDAEELKKLEQDFASFPKAQQADDVHVVNELHIWKEHPVVTQVRTLDVLHSFNIPYMRVKQDTLPGKIIPVWFTATKSNTIPRKDKEGNVHWEDGGGYDRKTGEPKDRHLIWDIACAELCGWGHYRMIGRVYVHEDQADFMRWLAEMEKRQRSTTAGTPTTAAP